MKNVRVLISESFDSLLANLSTYGKTITIGAKYDEGIVPGSIATYDSKDVCMRENQKINVMHPSAIGIRNFNFNILGGILSTINSKPSNTPQQKGFWIYLNYLNIHGFRRIFELSDYYKTAIFGYTSFAKKNPIPYHMSEQLAIKYPVMDISDRIRLYGNVLKEMLTNSKSKILQDGKEILKSSLDKIEKTHVKSNKRVMLRYTENLKEEYFYNPKMEMSHMLINYNEISKSFTLSYAYNIRNKARIELSFLHSFFKSYKKTAHLYEISKSPIKYVNEVLENVSFEMKDVQALFDYITVNKISKPQDK